ncbi:MAG: hypothetical protein ACJARX_001268 [Psychroserpens sp.]|jgi:hypothetical protein|uniref:hypothetical protein n=1 Tax=Psychroserpens sp. TaxID=2020870 RepID=UPI0039E5C3A2
MNDLNVSTVLIVILICHLTAILIGNKTRKTALVVSYLNAVMVFGIFIFWAIDTLDTKQHNFEFRNLLIIGLETSILLFALYSIKGFHNKTFIKIINYTGFGIHLLATTGVLLFISMFKFDRLF